MIRKCNQFMLYMWHILHSHKRMQNNLFYCPWISFKFYFVVHPTNESIYKKVQISDNSISVHLQMSKVYPMPKCTLQYKVCYIKQLFRVSCFTFDGSNFESLFLCTCIWSITFMCMVSKNSFYLRSLVNYLNHLKDI